jgi:hypothetical protein
MLTTALLFGSCYPTLGRRNDLGWRPELLHFGRKITTVLISTKDAICKEVLAGRRLT